MFSSGFRKLRWQLVWLSYGCTTNEYQITNFHDTQEVLLNCKSTTFSNFKNSLRNTLMLSVVSVTKTLPKDTREKRFTMWLGFHRRNQWRTNIYDLVTWYKMTCWEASFSVRRSNKAAWTSSAWLSFVFDITPRNLRPSMANFIRYCRVVQRAHQLYLDCLLGVVIEKEINHEAQKKATLKVMYVLKTTELSGHLAYEIRGSAVHNKVYSASSIRV